MAKSLELTLMPKPEVRNLETANQRAVISNKNSSMFMAQVYARLIRGTVNKYEKREEDTSGNGKQFVPDVKKIYPYGTELSEVKSTSVRNSIFLFSESQIENYAYQLLKRKREGERSPQVNFALFRYGRGHASYFLNKMDRREFVETLSGIEKDLTVIPINLLFFLLAFSRVEKMDQTSSQSSWDSQLYLILRGGLAGRLHREDGIIGTLTEEDIWQARDKINSENIHTDEQYRYRDMVNFISENVADFSLENLRTERTASEQIKVAYNGDKFVVPPFPITRFYMSQRNYSSWLRHFSQHHKRILDGLRLKDIFDDMTSDKIPY